MASLSYVFDSTVHPLFRRCVQCPPDPPSCPSCSSGETCSLQAQSCDSCASTTCVKIGNLPGQAAPKKATPVGGIVGGVVGGIIVLVGILFLIYRFRRKRRGVEIWDPPEKRDPTTLSRGDRQSTRSAHSIASTVFTRASNVIQIAYIPGVTVRSPPDSPGLPVPPVPSLPGGTAVNSARSTPLPEQHFFMPRDLRDSTWSDTSSIDPRISIAPSLARESVATTIYGSDFPPMPAQQAFRTQANVVSVKSGGNTPSPLSGTPASRTPQIPAAPRMAGSSIVAKTVTARPIEIKKLNSGPRVPTLGNLAEEAVRKSNTAMATASGKSVSSAQAVNVFSDEKEVVFSKSGTVSPSTTIEESPISPIAIPRPAFAGSHSARSSSVSAILPLEAPQGDSSSGPIHRHTNSNGATLNAMIEQAINRARDPQHIGIGSPQIRPELVKQDSGPFSDANEVKENSS